MAVQPPTGVRRNKMGPNRPSTQPIRGKRWRHQRFPLCPGAGAASSYFFPIPRPWHIRFPRATVANPSFHRGFLPPRARPPPGRQDAKGSDIVLQVSWPALAAMGQSRFPHGRWKLISKHNVPTPAPGPGAWPKMNATTKVGQYSLPDETERPRGLTHIPWQTQAVNFLVGAQNPAHHTHQPKHTPPCSRVFFWRARRGNESFSSN